MFGFSRLGMENKGYWHKVKKHLNKTFGASRGEAPYGDAAPSEKHKAF